MKEFLQKMIESIVEDDLDKAKDYFAKYMDMKGKHVLEAMLAPEKRDTDIVKGHCDDCGEDSTSTTAIVTSGKWTCGKCGSHHFEKDDSK